MATQEQIETILQQLKQIHTEDCFQSINETNAGIGAVLGYLYEAGESVTAGKISEKLHVSTARVAVLLKKMTAKGLILKESDRKDARVTVVRLSEHGISVFEALRNRMYVQLGAVIDQVGMDRILEFIQISMEMKDVVKRFRE